MIFTVSEIDFIVRILGLINTEAITAKQHYNIETISDFIEKKKEDFVIQEEQNKEELKLQNKTDEQELKKFRCKESREKYYKKNREQILKTSRERYKKRKETNPLGLRLLEQEKYLRKKAKKCWKAKK